MGDLDGAGGGVLEDCGEGVAALLRGDRVVGVAEDARRPAAQDRRGEGRRVARGAAEVDQPAAGRQSRGGRGRGCAEDRVDDDIDGTAGRVGEPLGQSRTSSASAGQRRPRRRRRARRARSRASSDRQTATIRPAPSTRAAPIAAWPTAPPPPSTSTRSPGWSCGAPGQRHPGGDRRQPERGHLRRRARSASSTIRSASGTAHRSARLPSPGAIPADGRENTRVPGATTADCSTTPTPCTPGTYGSAGGPKYDVPRGAQQVQRDDRRRGDADDRLPPRPARDPGVRRAAALRRGCAERRLARDLPQVAMSG